MVTIVGTRKLSANFEVRHYSIERLIARLTTPYEKSPASNIYNLLSIDADQFDEFRNTLDDIIKAHWVLYANDIALDYIGDLLDVKRRTGEDDDTYRGRLKTVVQSFVGGGTLEQLRKTIKEIIPGITDADITIEDGYLTPSHGVGDPSHYAHFRILIFNVGGKSFDAGTLFSELDKARAAGVTMDFAGPAYRETQQQTDSFQYGAGVLRLETQLQDDTFTYDMTKDAFSETQQILDPESLGPVDQFWISTPADGIGSYTDSLNLVYVPPEAQLSANFFIP